MTTKVAFNQINPGVIRSFATLADAVADTSISEGDIIDLKERTLSNGGSSVWDVVLTSTVTPNTYNIVQSVAVPTLSLVLRVKQIINAKEFGATGNGTTDDTLPIQAAITAAEADGSGVSLPPGSYRISSTLNLNGSCSLVGFGSELTTIVATDLVGAMIEYNIQTTSDGATGIRGLDLTVSYTGSPTASIGISFTGLDTAFLQYAEFKDIIFRGLTTPCSNTHNPRTTSFGQENNVSWCLFQDIRVRPGTNPATNGFDWSTGSGTGNNFNNCIVKVSSTGSCWNYSGVDSVVGDLSFNGCRGQAETTGGNFITVGDNTSYRQNVVFSGCQVDANLETPFNLSAVGTDEYRDWKWIGNLGGGTQLDDALGYVRGTILYDRAVSDMRVSYFASNLPSGNQTIDVFRVDVDQLGGCTLDINICGLSQGAGYSSQTEKWLIRNQTGTSSPTLEIGYSNPTATPRFTISQNTVGTVTTFSVELTPTATGSQFVVNAIATGDRIRLERLW